MDSAAGTSAAAPPTLTPPKPLYVVLLSAAVRAQPSSLYWRGHTHEVSIANVSVSVAVKKDPKKCFSHKGITTAWASFLCFCSLFTTVYYCLRHCIHPCPSGCILASAAVHLSPHATSPDPHSLCPTVLSPQYLLLSMMVWRRWAIVRTVQSVNSLRIVVWIKLSVSRSTAAVASSRMRILALRRRARARHTSCLCPTLG